VAEGIRQDRYGFEAHVKVNQRQVSKRFPPETRLTEMQRWRENARCDLRVAHELDHPRVKAFALTKSLDGWCYVYFIRSGDTVKIGMTVDPAARLRTLQTSHHVLLDLLAAVPAHAALESAIHAKFSDLRGEGEWFRLNDELIAFIKAVAAGQNPVALLW